MDDFRPWYVSMFFGWGWKPWLWLLFIAAVVWSYWTCSAQERTNALLWGAGSYAFWALCRMALEMSSLLEEQRETNKILREIKYRLPNK